MSLRTIRAVCFLLTLAAQGAYAGTQLQDLVEAAERLELSAHPQWLKLLHFDSATGQSEIVSEDFFLSPAGRRDPAKELEASLRAYSAEFGQDPNQHARCRFPARYYWLSQHIDLPGYSIREPRCQRLERWAQLDRLQSVSLLLVSGYLGNPASAFGHTLLKFNTNSPNTPANSTLLDLTFNFGALVPENELTVVYVYRGLSGGYQAGFSDTRFYSQDLVYARTEFRDMWEYQLSLPRDSVRLLAFHLWEVTGKKFTYYFLTKNCAYRLAELLELATGEDFLQHADVSYAPVELFHRLHALDASQSLIDSVRFIPSSQRTLYARFDRLNSTEAEAANTIIEDGGEGLQATLQRFENDRRIEIIDTVLAYYEYRVASQGREVSPELREAKDRVILARLRLPPGGASEPKISPRPSPAQGSAPMLFSGGLGHSTDSDYFQFKWAPFYYDLLGLNSIENGELVALETAVDFDDRGKVSLDHLDVIRVRRLNTNSVSVVGESRLSWQARIGAERRPGDGQQIDAFVNLGVGRALSLGGAIAYGSMDGWIRSGPGTFAADPNIGLLAGSGRWKHWIRGGARYEFETRRWTDYAAIDSNYQIQQHLALRLNLNFEEQTRVLLSLNRYW